LRGGVWRKWVHWDDKASQKASCQMKRRLSRVFMGKFSVERSVKIANGDTSLSSAAKLHGFVDAAGLAVPWLSSRVHSEGFEPPTLGSEDRRMIARRIWQTDHEHTDVGRRNNAIFQLSGTIQKHDPESRV
jgi:hypothetical protein